MALTNNLIAYWKMDESSGNPADATGNGHTLTNNNTVGFSAGKINNAADFGSANTNKYLRTTDDLISNYQADSFSASFWVNVTTAPGTGVQYLLGSFNNSTKEECDIYYQDSAGTKQFFLSYYNGTTSNSTTINYTLTLGTWFHICFVKNGTTSTLYVNAVSQGTLTQNIADASASRGGTHYGENFFNLNNPFSGLIDEAGVWTRALSSAEVSDLYNGGAGLAYPFSVAGGDTGYSYFM